MINIFDLKYINYHYFQAGVANFVISLTHQCPHDLAPYAGKLLAALLNGLHDRNITVKKTYASAIGHLVKVGKQKLS